MSGDDEVMLTIRAVMTKPRSTHYIGSDYMSSDDTASSDDAAPSTALRFGTSPFGINRRWSRQGFEDEGPLSVRLLSGSTGRGVVKDLRTEVLQTDSWHARWRSFWWF